MKSANEAQKVIAECLHSGFSLSTSSGKLTFRGKDKALPTMLRQKLESHKESIVEILKKVNVTEISQLQQHYFHHELSRGVSDSDLISCVVKIDADAIDSPACHERIARAVRSVEGLHVRLSSCREHGGYLEVPRQVSWSLPVVLHEEDDVACSSAEQVTHVGISVQDPQLFRIELHKVAGLSRGYLAVVIHHMISDAWSADILLERIQAECVGENSDASASITHGSGDCRISSAQQYADSLGLDDNIVPANFSRVVQRSIGPLATTHSFLDREVMSALALRFGVSQFVVVLSVFSELLNVYHGGSASAIGLPVLNRTTEVSKEQFGLFANVVPFVLPSGKTGESFEDYCRRVNSALAMALRYQDLSVSEFLKICRERGIQELLSFNQLLVQWLPSQPSSLQPGGIGYQRIPCQPGETNHLMTWTFIPSEDRCELVIDYRADIFTADFVQQLAEDFNYLLQAISAERQNFGGNSTLLPSSRRTLAFEQSLSRASTRKAHLIIEQLYERELAHPDRIALVSDDKSMSYRELVGRAEKLGENLRQNGAKEGDCIALYGDQSVHAVVGVVACQLVGCPYLYLDPSWPIARLQFMCEDSDARLVVRLPTAATSQQIGTIASVCYEDEIAESGDVCRSSCGALTEPYSYVIYTSGTTGQPKGVKIYQRQVTSLVNGCLQRFEIGEDRRWSLLHSLAFDFSVWELWGGLLSGGTVVLVSRAERADPHKLAKVLIQKQVSVFNGTPSVFDGVQPLLIHHSNTSRLERVFLGGERLNFSSLRKWFLSERGRQAHVYNVYGVTETTVLATGHRIDPRACEGDVQESPIGVPIPNWNVMIRDSRGRPLPIDAVGEIVISGDGVAAGYQNRDDLTSERFYRDTITGSVCYRTGDLGYRRSDGVLCYLGRADRQVKIAGHRIELGEIEAAINSQLGVESSRVLSIDSALVAFVQTANPQFDKPKLIDSLKRTLPGHMVPSQVLTLRLLPVKWNGKVDESVLRGYYSENRENRSPSCDTGVDHLLLSILECFGQSLGRHDVKPDTDFFLAGGDSIKCLALLRRLHDRGLSLELRTIYERRTPQGLFEIANSAKAAAETSPYKPFSKVDEADKALIPVGIDDAIPMTRMQQSMLFHGIIQDGRATYINATAYAVETAVTTDELVQRIDASVDRYSALRSRFDIGMYSKPLQLIQSNVAVDIEICNINSPKIAVDDWLRQFCDGHGSASFDPQQAPLWRCAILVEGSRVLALGLAFHHAILDGWSVSLLVDQLLGDRGVREGKEPFPAQALCLDGSGPDENVSKLLPTCPPRASKSEGPGQSSASQFVHLTQDQSKKLETAAKRAGTTLKALAMGLMCRAIADLIHSTDLGIGVITHNRPAIPGGDVCIGNFLSSSFLELSDCSRSGAEMSRTIQEWLEYVEREQRGSLSGFEARLIGEQSPIFLNYVDFSAYTQVGYVIHRQVIREVTDLPMIACFVKNFTALQHSLEVQWIPALCDSSFVDRFLSRWGELCDQALVDVITPQAGVSVLFERDDHLSARSTGRIAETILNQARGYPNAIAVEAGDGTLTYGQLHERVLRYSSFIRARGIAVGDRIGIDYSPSCERIPLLVAILNSGCTVVPVDSRFDALRSKALVEKTRAKLMFAPRESKLNELSSTVAMEDVRELSFGVDVNSPDDNGRVAEIAYMIGTSGSTGQPKIAMVKSEALDHHNRWMLQKFSFSQSSKVLHRTSPLFDASMWEILVPLYCGGVVVIGAEETLFAPDAITKVIDAHRVTHLQLTPTLARYWVSTLEDGRHTSISDVFCGGEVLTREIIEAIPRTIGARLHNLYGPSETTIDVLVDESITPDSWRDRSIGRPIPNVGVVILDSNHQPTPVGAVGELGIFGIAVGVGYFEDPIKTSARFVECTLPDQGKQRVYLTGDRAVAESDGTITFRGRGNRETKVRGLRIDLDQLEAALRQSEREVDPYVFVSDNANQVDCWFFTKGGHGDDDVRRLLSALLGPELVGVVFKGALMPQLASGKPDRTAMKSEIDQSSRLISDGSIDSTPSPVERQVAAIWAKVLRSSVDNLDRGFLESGGSSLNLLKVQSELNLTFQVKLNVLDLLKRSTVRQHALQVEAMRGEKG